MRIRRATPPGTSALHVVEIEGEGAIALVDSCVRGVRVLELDRGRVRRVEFVDDERVIDDGLLWIDDREQELVRATLHGNPHLVRAWIDALRRRAPRVDPEGSPSIVSEVESLLPAARTVGAVDLIARQADPAADGLLRLGLQWLGGVAVDAESVTPIIAARAAGIAATRPIDVVLTGPPNAGKSTLFNRLLGESRSVTDATAGTTRDVIVEVVEIGDASIRLHDVAGLRESSDPVESEGVRRARSIEAIADVVVELRPPGAEAELPTEDGFAGSRIAVLSRADEAMPSDRSGARLPVSARTGEGIDALVDRILAARGVTRRFPGGPVPVTERQVDRLVELRERAGDRERAVEIARDLVGLGAPREEG